MNLREYFEILTNDCSNALYVEDINTHEIIFLNQTMERKFQIIGDYRGKTGGEVIPLYANLTSFQNKENLEIGQFYDHTFFSETLNCKLHGQSTLMEIHNRKLLLTKYFIAPNSEKRIDTENVFEKSIALCLEILSNPTILSPIDSFLQLLGEFYACNLTYVIELNEQTSEIPNYYLWTQQQGRVSQVPEIVNSEDLESFIQWLGRSNHKNIINLDRNIYYYPKHSMERQILEQYNIDNITLGKIWKRDGSLRGVIGLSNRAELMYDDRLLQAISHFIMEQFNKTSMIEAIEDLSDIDPLTGFYSRKKYLAQLDYMEKFPSPTLGVLFVNMNGLRNTNEFLGYEAGDEQLKKTATLLNEYFNNNFYRVTGDEFIGFVPDCDADIFNETIETLQTRLKNQKSETNFSLGHSWGDGSYQVRELIKIADNIMVINKQTFYHDALQDLDKIKNSMLKDLFYGLEQEEFLVFLQPQVDLNTEEILGAEALIRRKRADKMIFPDQFITTYEENGLIRHVDLFVARKVCQLLKEWNAHGKEMTIAVNFSRVTLLEHGIVDTITAIVDEFQIPHKQIIIEITERIGVTENDVASRLVDHFKEKGFRISLDDFGCAYSNIVTLAKVSFDEVKIDKSLVDDIMINEKNQIIVECMLNMCHKIPDTHTLAEGIETKEQADFLRSAHCDLGQGYYYSRPMPTDEFFKKYIAQEQ